MKITIQIEDSDAQHDIEKMAEQIARIVNRRGRGIGMTFVGERGPETKATPIQMPMPQKSECCHNTNTVPTRLESLDQSHIPVPPMQE